MLTTLKRHDAEPPAEAPRQMVLVRVAGSAEFPGGVVLTLAPKPGGPLALDLGATTPPLVDDVLAEVRERVAELRETAKLADARRRLTAHRAVLADAALRASDLRRDVAAEVRAGSNVEALEALEAELADADRRADTLAKRTPILEDAVRVAERPAELAARSEAADVIKAKLPPLEQLLEALAEKVAIAADAAAARYVRRVVDRGALQGMAREAASHGTAALDALGLE